MDRADLLREMIAEKEKQIELYRAMVAEWRRELGDAGHASAPEAVAGHDGATHKESVADDGLVGMVRDYEFHGKSQPEAAKLFLDRVGHPVKTHVILEALQKGGITIGGKEESRKMNLYTILNRSRDFGRVARDTWGLVGWRGVPKKDAKEGDGEVKEGDKDSA